MARSAPKDKAPKYKVATGKPKTQRVKPEVARCPDGAFRRIHNVGHQLINEKENCTTCVVRIKDKDLVGYVNNLTQEFIPC